MKCFVITKINFLDEFYAKTSIQYVTDNEEDAKRVLFILNGELEHLGSFELHEYDCSISPDNLKFEYTAAPYIKNSTIYWNVKCEGVATDTNKTPEVMYYSNGYRYASNTGITKITGIVAANADEAMHIAEEIGADDEGPDTMTYK